MSHCHNHSLNQVDPEIFSLIGKEEERQSNHLELIASENIASLAVREAMQSVLTDKYAEGYPGKRYYGGCKIADEVENLAIARLKKLYGSEHANVQPHSGSQANMAVYFSFVNPGDKVLAMDLSHGGHLTHGSRVNFSGKFYDIIPYGVDPKTEMIDYDLLESLANEHKPRMIVSGGSAYSRKIDFERIQSIAKRINAIHWCDMAHYSGLIAAKEYPNPVPFADVVTSTTHKSIRGPRGGMILCKEEFAKKIDKQIFPGIQGGPLMHVIAAKAVCFHEASQESFKSYQIQVKKNASALSKVLNDGGVRIVSGGTDSHLFLADMKSIGFTGHQAQELLDSVQMTTNKNTIPFDTEKPTITSGIRIGSPALTTRGMKEVEMEIIGNWMLSLFKDPESTDLKRRIIREINDLCEKFPLPSLLLS